VRGAGLVVWFRSRAESILALPGGVQLVAVDGYGGAGKSTFAARLAAALGGAAVVNTAAFATGEPGVEWWPRLEREVIAPLSAGEAARYRRWDWQAKRRGGGRMGGEVHAGGLERGRRDATPAHV